MHLITANNKPYKQLLPYRAVLLLLPMHDKRLLPLP